LRRFRGGMKSEEGVRAKEQGERYKRARKSSRGNDGGGYSHRHCMSGTLKGHKLRYHAPEGIHTSIQVDVRYYRSHMLGGGELGREKICGGNRRRGESRDFQIVYLIGGGMKQPTRRKGGGVSNAFRCSVSPHQLPLPD